MQCSMLSYVVLMNIYTHLGIFYICISGQKSLCCDYLAGLFCQSNPEPKHKLTLWDLPEIENSLNIQRGLEYEDTESSRACCFASLPEKMSLFPWSVKWIKEVTVQDVWYCISWRERLRQRERSCWGNCVFYVGSLSGWLFILLRGIAIVLVLESVESNLKWCSIIEMWFAAYVLQCNTYHQAL